MLRKGDSVIMHDCDEAEHYQGIIWTCETDEWQTPSDRSVVKLKGYSGAFAVDCLLEVNPTDDNTVICESCDKVILADSKGYEVYLESEVAYCLKCDKAASEQLQAQQFVHNSLNESSVTHTVIKNDDIKEFLDREDQLAFEFCIEEIANGRTKAGNRNTPYIVINTDEDPRMIKEIIEVMKRYEKWG